MKENKLLEYSNTEKRIQELEKQKEEILSRNSLIFSEIKKIEAEQKELQERQKLIKPELKSVMEDIYNKNGNDVFENEILRIKFVHSYEKTIVDNDKLKKEYEDVYLECLKKSKVESTIKITIK